MRTTDSDAPSLSLWRHPDFLKLWAGQTVSQFGSRITVLALPLTAALALGASAFQMGLLAAIESAPVLMIGLIVGVWVDRLRRRPLLIAADLGRAVLLASIPLTAWRGALRIEQLYVVALGAGLMTVCFDVAYAAYLPTLIGREQLVEGNSKLEASRSAAQIAGPGLAGVLVQLVTAPLAILADALSFLVSALCLALVRAAEPRLGEGNQRRSVWRELAEGLRVVGGSPVLRAMGGVAATWNLSGGVLFAVFVLYVTRALGLGAAVLGVILASGNAGFLLGALLARRAARRFGPGPTLRGALTLGALAWQLVPLAGGPAFALVALLVAGQCVGSLGLTIYNVNAVSLRQAITPDQLQGRVTATMQVISLGTSPLGFLIGGVLGEVIDLRPTLAVGGVMRLGVLLWLWLSPLRALRGAPARLESAA